MNLDETTDKIEISVPIEQFEYEARDYVNNLSNFLKSPIFLKEFKLEGRYIQTIAKVWGESNRVQSWYP